MPRTQDLAARRPEVGDATDADADAEVADGLTTDQDGRAHAALCLLAARLLLREMDGPSRDALLRDGAHLVLEKLAPGCARYLERKWDEPEIETAAVEYCRLFLLPGGAPPFASAWLANGSSQGHEVAARCAAAAAGLGLEGTTPDNLPADHLGVLMIVLAEAWQAADSAGQPACALREELFGPWLEPFLAKLAASTTNPLYRALGGLIGVITQP